MSETALSNSQLAITLQAVATQIGDRLPAAFGMEPGTVALAGDLDTHAMPADAVAVRWPLGAEEATLVVAMTPDAADMLRAGPPEVSLVDALTALLADALDGLAPLLEGGSPALGAGEEVAAEEALAAGPGDAVSVPLDDAGTHRATIGMRLVVSDDLMQPPGTAPEAATAEQATAEQATAEAETREAETVGLAPEAPVEYDPAPAGPVGAPVAAADPMGIGQAGPAMMPAAGIPLANAAQTAPGAGIPLPGDATKKRAPRPVAGAPQAEAHPAEFASFDQLTALPSAAHSMAMLGEVEMGVTAELGRTRMTVRDVLAMNPGSIIELDRAAGSPVDVVVNGTLIARGEVVVIDEEFGIRITEIMGMAEEADPFPLQVAQ